MWLWVGVVEWEIVLEQKQFSLQDNAPLNDRALTLKLPKVKDMTNLTAFLTFNSFWKRWEKKKTENKNVCLWHIMEWMVWPHSLTHIVTSFPLSENRTHTHTHTYTHIHELTHTFVRAKPVCVCVCVSQLSFKPLTNNCRLTQPLNHFLYSNLAS